MSRKPILLIDHFVLVKVGCLPTYQVGAVMLVAMQIASEGPLEIEKIKKVARLKGRRKWVSSYFEANLFLRKDGFLHLHADAFVAKTVGSDKARSPLPKAVRLFVHERDQYLCAYCGTGEGPFDIDHIHPVSKGGTDDLDNLCLACRSCNLAKSNKLLTEWVR